MSTAPWSTTEPLRATTRRTCSPTKRRRSSEAPGSYNEPNAADKPAWVRSLAPLTTGDGVAVDAFRRGQLESLLAVDDAVGDLLDALADTGRLDETLFVFTSDNGYLWGEHR